MMKPVKASKTLTQEGADIINRRILELSERRCGMPTIKDGSPCKIKGKTCRRHRVLYDMVERGGKIIGIPIA